MFDGSSALYWILVVGVLAYAASYFARGWLAGHERFALYGGLVFLESTSRFLFALAVAVGIALRAGRGRPRDGGGAVRLAVRDPVRLLARPGHAARPACPRPTPPREGPAHAADRGGRRRPDASSTEPGSPSSVVGIMLAEQTLMNAGVLIVAATTGAGALTAG